MKGHITYIICLILTIASCKNVNVKDLDDTTQLSFSFYSPAVFVAHYGYNEKVITRLSFPNGDNYFYSGKYPPDMDFSTLDNYVYCYISSSELIQSKQVLSFGEDGRVGIGYYAGSEQYGDDTSIFILPCWQDIELNDQFYMYSEYLDSVISGYDYGLMDLPFISKQNLYFLSDIPNGNSCIMERKYNADKSFNVKYYRIKGETKTFKEKRQVSKKHNLIIENAVITETNDSIFIFDYYVGETKYRDTCLCNKLFYLENYYVGDIINIWILNDNPRNYRIIDVCHINDNEINDVKYFYWKNQASPKTHKKKHYRF